MVLSGTPAATTATAGYYTTDFTGLGFAISAFVVVSITALLVHFVIAHLPQFPPRFAASSSAKRVAVRRTKDVVSYAC